MSVSSNSETSITTSTPSSSKENLYGPTGKRLDYITWHQLHMFMARSLAEMAENEDSEAEGCYIVDQEHYQLSTGYSGESSDATCRHAVNIALEKLKTRAARPEGAVLYTTALADCAQCARSIADHKIAVLWYWHEARLENHRPPIGVKCQKYVPTRRISIDFHDEK